MGQRRHKGDGGLYTTIVHAHGDEYTYWVADWKDRNGKRHRASGSTPDEALARKNKKIQVLAKETKAKPRKSPAKGTTVAAAIDQWLAENQHIGETSRGKYSRNLARYVTPFIGSMPIRSVTRERIVMLEAQQDAQGIGPSAKRHVWKNLNAMMRWAVRAGKISTNPMEGIDPPKATNYRSARIEAHIDKHVGIVMGIIAWTSQQDCPWHWYHPVIMAMSLGLRRAEVLGITRDAIDLGNYSLEVRARLMQRPGKGGYVLRPATKNGHNRTVRVPQPHYQALLEALHRHAEDAATLPIEVEDGTTIGQGQLLFVREDGSPLSYNDWNMNWWAVQQAYKDYISGGHTKLTQEEYVLPHEMRHIAASILGEEGETLPTIQSILGHLTPAMTEHYAHILEKGREDTAQRWGKTIENGINFFSNFDRETAAYHAAKSAEVDSGEDSSVLRPTTRKKRNHKKMADEPLQNAD